MEGSDQTQFINLSDLIDWKKLYPDPLPNLTSLVTPFSTEEIKIAMFSLAKNKSPDLDGFQISFYQK